MSKSLFRDRVHTTIDRTFEEINKREKVQRHMRTDYDQFYETVMQAVEVHEISRVEEVQLRYQLQEYFWHKARRPYFHLYPSVIKALERSRLNVRPADIPTSVVHDLKRLCVKLPMRSTHRLLVDVEHFHIWIHQLAIDAKEQVSGESVLTFAYHTTDDSFHEYPCLWNQTFESAERNPKPIELIDGQEQETEMDCDRRHLIARLGIGVMMLAADERYIEPILLQRDRKRPNVDPEAAAKRARRRGLIGFNIGAHMENSPHFRRAHFGIRWTGEGRRIPKLVPIKSAIVNRKKVTEVPTGYELP